MAIPYPILTIAAALCLLFASRLRNHLRARAFISRTGCQPPPKIDGGFLGIRAARETTKALKLGQYMALSRHRFASTGNTYQGLLLGQPFVATIEPENLKAIFTRIDDFSKGGRRTDWWPLLKGGILIADGAEWKASRALLQPSFAKMQLTDFSKLEHHASKLISRIPGDGATVELQELFLDLTTNVGLDHFLGHRTEVSEYEQQQQKLLYHNLHRGLFEAGRRAKIGIFRLLDVFTRPRELVKYLRACRDIHRYFDRLIDGRLEKLSRTAAKESTSAAAKGEKEVASDKAEPYVFIDHLLTATQDREQLRWELSTALAGLRDTTGGLLSHIFWTLARNPHMWTKLQEEIDDKLGGQLPTHETLRELVYLKAIVFESLRMYPNIGITFRWSFHDTTLPVGGGPDGKSPCFVPAGCRIITSFNALHRRPDVWGADADEFRPERWLTPVAPPPAKSSESTTFRLKAMPAWTFLPFGGGPRICPGQHFALLAAQYTIVRMLQAFRKIEARDDRPYAEEAGIPVTLKYGAFVGLKEQVV